MIRALVVFVLIRRPVLLTDWLDAPVELKHRVFQALRWSEHVHEVCPGFCGCADTALAADEERAALDAALAG